MTYSSRGTENSESHLGCCVQGPGEATMKNLSDSRKAAGSQRPCQIQPNAEMQLSSCQAHDFLNNINVTLVFGQALYKGCLLPLKNNNHFKLMRGKNPDFLLHENASGPTPLLFWPLSLPSSRSRDGSQAGLGV